METAALHPPELAQIKRPDLLVVSNESSFSSEKMAPKLEALANLRDESGVNSQWGSIEFLATTKDDEYLDNLISKITPGCTLVVSGGDGTVKRTLQRLRSKGFTGEEIDILIAGAGGENVVAKILHGKKKYNDPLAVLKKGKKRTIFPGEAMMYDQDGNHLRTEEFLFSLSLNAGAIAMRKYFNNPVWRSEQQKRGQFGQWKTKYIDALNAVMTSPAIKTSLGEAINIAIAAGEFSAGRKLKYDTALSNNRELLMAHTKPNFSSVLASYIGRKITPGRAPGDTWHNGTGEIRIDSDAEAEADGENIESIPAGTTMRFRRVSQGIAVLALESS